MILDDAFIGDKVNKVYAGQKNLQESILFCKIDEGMMVRRTFKCISKLQLQIQ